MFQRWKNVDFWKTEILKMFFLSTSEVELKISEIAHFRVYNGPNMPSYTVIDKFKRNIHELGTKTGSCPGPPPPLPSQSGRAFSAPHA